MKAIFIAMLFLAVNSANAGDPTRPPEAYVTPAPSSLTDLPGSSRLLFIVFDKQQRKGQKPRSRAMIDGEIRSVGDTIGDTKLIRIKADSVLLSGPSGTEELFLTPEIALQPRKPEGKRK